VERLTQYRYFVEKRLKVGEVTRTALQNAASVASLLLTTESLVTDIPKEEEEGGGHDHPCASLTGDG